MRSNARGKATWIDMAVASLTDECILWPWGLVDGYGRVRHDGRGHLVHVLVCERVHGPRPLGLQVAHWCGVRACANPRHLRWATRADNLADKLRHGTHNRGERHPLAKLTIEQVCDIRERYAAGNTRLQDLADEYGVSVSNIHYIVTEQTWVTDPTTTTTRSTA